MAKAQVVAEQLPATQTQGTDLLPPEQLGDLMDQHAGEGVSQRAEDNLVPMLAVLQALSPQVDRRNVAHVNGAEPGAIWLKNSPVEIVPGEQGIEFQPCWFDVAWVEWVPRRQGGGFVARHKDRPKEATFKEVQGDNGPQMRWVMPGGNELIETRYHVGRARLPNGVVMPFMIPFTSTGHTVSRDWHTKMNTRITRKGQVAPSFSTWYHLTTVQRQKNNYSWFVLKVDISRWLAEEEVEDFKAGAKLAAAMSVGETKLAEEEHVGGASQVDPSTEAM